MKQQQRGATLLMALVFLLVITVLALSSVQGVGMQERMAANLYDRDLALQSTEAALHAAEAALLANPEPLGTVDCTATSIENCSALPENTFRNDNTGWTTISSDFLINETTQIGIPQYHIQLVGRGETGVSFSQYNSANNMQYGVNPGIFNEQYYRITARSTNPANAQGRAIVVLQTTVKRTM